MSEIQQDIYDHVNIYIYIYIYFGVKDLPLRDMISLGAWRMGLECSGKILPSPPPSSPTRGGGGEEEFEGAKPPQDSQGQHASTFGLSD